MRRVRFLTTVCGIAATAGCVSQNNQQEVLKQYLPDAQLSTDRLDFGSIGWGEVVSRTVTLSNNGELPMGIERIGLNEDGMEDNFTLSWSPEDITCPGAEGASAARAEVDTATGGGDDSGNGGGDGGDDGGGSSTDGITVLNAGCKFPITVNFSPTTVGSVYGSFSVDTVTESAPSDSTGSFTPAYYRDPDNFHKVALMEARAERGFGNVVITPRTVDMGHLWTGESATRYVYIYNVGDGDLTLGEPVIDSSCDPGFTIDLTRFDEDRIIPAGASTLFEVSYAPTDTDTAYCSVVVPTDDEDSLEVEVKLQGNAGEDPAEVPPTVSIRSPEVGYVHTTGEPVIVKLNVFDQNQPATSLTCKIKSAVLQEASLAKCVPTDESGYVEVELPIDLLDAGVDTLLVTVTDQAEKQAHASTTLLWKVDYPESDDDGDGYGDDDPTSPTWDCDDHNSHTYPAAAEIYDGEDNDCDGGIDEGTTGFDDDGDSVSEADGDCDDDDSSTYPGAPETADRKDNDCDGVVDEGTTLYDDDGDGFSEVDNDCKDDDAAINPAAEEICDGIDNNCNGLKDNQEGCLESDTTPLIIGDIRMSANAIGVGESSTMSVQVVDLDGQEVTCAWQEDPDLTGIGHVAIDFPSGKTITWTAPATMESDGEQYNVYVICADEEGNQDWAFDEITVYPEPVQTYTETIVQNASAGGCSGSGYGGGHKNGEAPVVEDQGTTPTDTGAALLLPFLGLLGLGRRLRRREDEE